MCRETDGHQQSNRTFWNKVVCVVVSLATLACDLQRLFDTE